MLMCTFHVAASDWHSIFYHKPNFMDITQFQICISGPGKDEVECSVLEIRLGRCEWWVQQLFHCEVITYSPLNNVVSSLKVLQHKITLTDVQDSSTMWKKPVTASTTWHSFTS